MKDTKNDNEYYVQWDVSYKNLLMVALKNSNEEKLTIHVLKEGKIIKEFRASQWYNEDDGVEYLENIYEQYLYKDIIYILKNETDINITKDEKGNKVITIQYTSLDDDDYKKVMEGLDL